MITCWYLITCLLKLVGETGAYWFSDSGIVSIFSFEYCNLNLIELYGPTALQNEKKTIVYMKSNPLL